MGGIDRQVKSCLASWNAMIGILVERVFKGLMWLVLRRLFSPCSASVHNYCPTVCKYSRRTSGVRWMAGYWWHRSNAGMPHFNIIIPEITMVCTWLENDVVKVERVCCPFCLYKADQKCFGGEWCYSSQGLQRRTDPS